MFRLERQFNDVNDKTLSSLLIYQNTDNQLRYANERLHFLDTSASDVGKDTYFFTTSLLSDIINQLGPKPEGSILTNQFDVAVGLSAYYDNDVLSVASNVFPPVKIMRATNARFSINFIPYVENVDLLQHVISNANNNDNVIFINDV
jgi:hypothetical protein